MIYVVTHTHTTLTCLTPTPAQHAQYKLEAHYNVDAQYNMEASYRGTKVHVVHAIVNVKRQI